MTEACLGLGVNLGDREANLFRAIRQLSATDGIRRLAVSRVFRTAPWGGVAQPDFLNLCLRIETTLTPHALLTACKAVEQNLGRQARERWGPREIDIDILMMDGAEMASPELTVPHPRLTQRRFVLEPLAEIAPDWRVQGREIVQHAAELRAAQPEVMCEPDPDASQRLLVALG